MQNHPSSRPLKLPKEFLVGDNYLTPADSIEVSILDQMGTLVGKHTIDLENDVFTVPSTHLGLAGMELAKPLFLMIRFTTDDIDYEVQQIIRLIQFKPITVTTNQVRSQVGATFDEMPDSGFDIYGSYLELCEKLQQDIFSEPVKMLKANRLILLHTLIKELPTLSLRLLNSKSIDDHKFTRNRINIAEISTELKSEYELLMMSDFSKEPEAFNEPLLTIVQRTDPFSGE